MNRFTDVIVVVHGIGDQMRNATVRSVANRIATSRGLGGTGTSKLSPVAPQPLGYFYNDPKGVVLSRLVDRAPRLSGTGLSTIGVAEVFWADIPRSAVDEKHTLEETKDWARTVVARAKALYEDAGRPAYVKPDFHQASEVLEEMIDTIYVLENFCAIAEKLGLFTFDLSDVLEDYLGDVQIVAEFSAYRADIVGRFHKAMEDVYTEVGADNPDVRLHIVAHSEGTVVSFLGLLQAMSHRKIVPANPISSEPAKIVDQSAPPSWLGHVAGYMTIGSPIDKHLLLWPEMWEDLTPEKANPLYIDTNERIKWRNYYDYGDPVGFKLDTARDWLRGPVAAARALVRPKKGATRNTALDRIQAFEFEEEHDHGFARYPLPGAAHNAYWDDPEVFEHFISEVIKPVKDKKIPTPPTLPLVAILSPLIPYVVSFVILMAGTYLLYKQVTQYAHPEPEPFDATVIAERLGITRSSGADGSALLVNVFSVAALIAGTTLVARLPRLMSHKSWMLLAALGFSMGALAYCQFVDPDSREEIGEVFTRWWGEGWATWGVIAMAAGVGIVGWAAAKVDRRKVSFWRMLTSGMRPMIICGAIGIAMIAGSRVFPRQFGMATRLTPDETALVAAHVERATANVPPAQRACARESLQAKFDENLFAAGLTREELDQFFGKAEPCDPIAPESAEKHLANFNRFAPLLGIRPPVWPIFLAAGAFIYLWWLGALIFDLSFVWQRYIRESTTNRHLNNWYRVHHAPGSETALASGAE